MSEETRRLETPVFNVACRYLVASPARIGFKAKLEISFWLYAKLMQLHGYEIAFHEEGTVVNQPEQLILLRHDPNDFTLTKECVLLLDCLDEPNMPDSKVSRWNGYICCIHDAVPVRTFLDAMKAKNAARMGR